MSHTMEAQIRALVRELITDIMPDRREVADVRTVRIENNADLAALITTVLDLTEQPKGMESLRSGRIQFLLDPAPARGGTTGMPSSSGSATPPPRAEQSGPGLTGQRGTSVRVEKGAVTEKMIIRAASSGTRFLLGPRAVLTPLAKESARRNGVEIERVP